MNRVAFESNTSPLSALEMEKFVMFFAGGAVISSNDVLVKDCAEACPVFIAEAGFSDGTWIWTSFDAHRITKHGHRPSEGFLEHVMARNGIASDWVGPAEIEKASILLSGSL